VANLHDWRICNSLPAASVTSAPFRLPLKTGAG
jgi:hypothetical protein